MSIQSLGGKSNSSVVKASGKSWQEWVDILDAAKLQDTPHKEIVQWLWDNDYAGSGDQPLSGWWAQTVVVGYEYHHGRRVKGQTADAGFEVGAQKTLPIDQSAAWDLITSDEGLKIWLDASLDEINFEKGAEFETKSGVKGEIRSLVEGEKIRLRYQPPRKDKPTTLQIYLIASGDSKTRLLFHEEKLSSSKEREDAKAHWKRVLDRLSKTV